MLHPVLVASSTALADIASELNRGRSCLVECEKPNTSLLMADLRDRLGTSRMLWEVVDGRPVAKKGDREDQGVITTMLVQLRKRVRAINVRTAVVLPYLDILAAAVAGLTAESREVVPLLYENPEIVWLAFRDPSLPLLTVVEKRFEGRYQLGAASHHALTAVVLGGEAKVASVAVRPHPPAPSPKGEGEPDQPMGEFMPTDMPPAPPPF